MNTAPHVMRILIHAHTQGGLARARNNAVNLKKDTPDAEVLIVANADGVAAVLDAPHPDTDALTLVCASTLQRLDRSAQEPLRTVRSGIAAIVEMQREGWLYVRA